MQHGEAASELISVVAPVYNEVDGLAEFHRRVATALAGRQYELVLVNDGSTDGSTKLLGELAGADPAVRPVQLSRNFGHQAAVTAGIDASRGEGDPQASAEDCLDAPRFRGGPPGLAEREALASDASVRDDHGTTFVAPVQLCGLAAP